MAASFNGATLMHSVEDGRVATRPHAAPISFNGATLMYSVEDVSSRARETLPRVCFNGATLMYSVEDGLPGDPERPIDRASMGPRRCTAWKTGRCVAV